MMKTLIILTLLGCDDGVSHCDVLQQPETAYASEQACQQAADALLQGSFAAPYPTVVTQCATPQDTIDFVHRVVPPEQTAALDRKNVEEGKGVSVRDDIG